MKLLALLAIVSLTGCTTVIDPVTGKKHLASTFSVEQRKAFLGDVTALASFAAGAYGGPGASAGLSALGAVMQGYVGTVIPSTVVAASPGVGSMGRDLAGLISPTAQVTQGDVDAIHAAAALANPAANPFTK